MSTALGGARVQVPNGYEALADEVLRRCRDGEYEAALAELLGLALLILPGVPLKVSTPRCTCRSCGMRWNENG